MKRTHFIPGLHAKDCGLPVSKRHKYVAVLLAVCDEFRITPEIIHKRSNHPLIRKARAAGILLTNEIVKPANGVLPLLWGLSRNSHSKCIESARRMVEEERVLEYRMDRCREVVRKWLKE
jgi:hypothetical protein